MEAKGRGAQQGCVLTRPSCSPRKNWLTCVGSPMSRIDRAVFSNERQISSLEFHTFTTKY